MNLRRAILLPAVALIASALTVAPASADPGNPFDIYSVETSDVRVDSSACRSVPMTVRHNAGPLEDAWAVVEMWRGSRYIDEQILFDSYPGKIADSALICPSFSGLGKFRFGPSQISFSTPDYASSGTFRDATTSRTISVLQDSRASKAKATRKGRKVTVTAKATFYDFYSGRWRATPKGTKYQLQRQTAGGSWSKVKSGHVGKTGKISVKTNRSKRATYRVKVNAGKQTWSAVSKSVRK